MVRLALVVTVVALLLALPAATLAESPAPLPPAIEIVGDVRNPDGSPAAGATVYAEITAGVTSAVTTGEDGSFVLLVDVEPGTLVRIDAQGPASEVPGDDPACRYTTFRLGIVEVEAVAQGVTGVVIVLDQEGQSAVCAETGAPDAGGEGQEATLPPTDASSSRAVTSAPLLALLLAAAAAAALGVTVRHGARRG